MIRMTNQRKIILEELKKLKSHPTADELYSLVRKRMPRISLGTVYRNLDVMNRKGLIDRIICGNGPHRYDGNNRRHYHVKCRCCGRIADLEISDFPFLKMLEKVDLPAGIRCVRIEFEDICTNCGGSSGEDVLVDSNLPKNRSDSRIEDLE